MNERRLEELETKIAYQEDTIQQLNEVLGRQQKQIDQLEISCQFLINRLRESDEISAPGNEVDERPPHY